MTKPDQVRLTFDQNPALLEALKDVKLGDKGKLEIHYTLKGRDEEGLDLTIEAAVPEGYEIDDKSEGEPGSGPAVNTSEAMMTPAAMLVKKKSSA